MLEWLRENWSFVAAMVGGSLVSVFSINTHSWTEGLIRMGCGLAVASIFTDGFVKWAGLDPVDFTVSVAGMLAITGFGLAKILSNITFDNVIKIIKLIRGIS